MKCGQETEMPALWRGFRRLLSLLELPGLSLVSRVSVEDGRLQGDL